MQERTPLGTWTQTRSMNECQQWCGAFLTPCFPRGSSCGRGMPTPHPMPTEGCVTPPHPLCCLSSLILGTVRWAVSGVACVCACLWGSGHVCVCACVCICAYTSASASGRVHAQITSVHLFARTHAHMVCPWVIISSPFPFDLLRTMICLLCFIGTCEIFCNAHIPPPPHCSTPHVRIAGDDPEA